MAFTDAELMQELITVKNEMQLLKDKIFDADFLRDPRARMRDLREAHAFNNDQYDVVEQELIMNVNELKRVNACAQQQRNSKNIDPNLNAQIRKAQNDAAVSSDNLNVINEEIIRLEAELEKFENDPDYIKYINLYKRKNEIENNLNADHANGIQLLEPENKINLCENLSTFLTDDNAWFNRLKDIYSLEINSLSNDNSLIEFTSPEHDVRIQVHASKVDSVGEINEENKAVVVSAMLAIFIKSIENTNSKGCLVTEYAPEIIKFMESQLARTLMDKSDQYANYKINGVPVTDIVNRADGVARAHTVNGPAVR